jgi:gamma-glutamyltranspeptidase/glutathione hydrolase
MTSFLTSLSPAFPHIPSASAMVFKSCQWLGGLLTLQTALASPVANGYGYAPSPPKLKAGHLGAVASESEICSHIGIELLKKGGNAADALVGTVACIGVVGMYHSGKSKDNMTISRPFYRGARSAYKMELHLYGARG